MTNDLIQDLTNPSNNVRLHAALQIGSQPQASHPAVVEALVERLGHEDDFQVREMLTWAAVQVAGETGDALVAKLDDPQPSVRQQAAHVLSKIGDARLADTQHADALAAVVADPESEVAVKAFRAAANTGRPSVVPMLVARLGDPDLELRDALTRALTTLGETAVPALVQSLSSDRAEVREHAADALGHIGSPAADGAVAALAALLADEDPELRLTAVAALGQLDPELAGDTLRSAAEGPDARVAQVAARFLG